MANKTKSVVCYVKEDTLQLLDKASQMTNRSRSNFIESAVIEKVKQVLRSDE